MTAGTRRRWLRGLLATTLVVSGLVAATVSRPAPAEAALSGSSFDPGHIISDEQFFAGTSMTESQVQGLLDSKMTSCQATDPNLPCLRSLRTSTVTRSATAYCAAYNAEGWETAARIITKVGRACGISPKVLLVLLEKEQSLVTSRKPTAYAYQRAMGFACPDTAPCDAQYFGFFNQVYSAASRFKQYTATPTRWNYKIGTNSILYHPNRDCGWNWVTIRNQATANLYIYTPYQPDAAALANLYGTGGPCSSYGNRNFWRLYNEWFGPSTSSVNGFAAVDAEAAARRAVLGSPTSAHLTGGAYGSGVARVYTGGSIFWTAATGARSVYGPIRDRYFAAGSITGPLKWPTSDRVAMPQRPGGAGQAFQGGSIYTSSGTGTFSVRPPVLTHYFRLGGATGPAGWPRGEAVSVAGGTVQAMESGRLMVSSRGGYLVPTAVLAGYGTSLHSSEIGWPTSPASAIGKGQGQAFTGGSVYVSAAGAFAVRQPVLKAYFAQQGAAGPLGFPTSTATCTAGTCVQSFTGGTVSVGPDGASRVVNPAIEEVATREAQQLGARTSGLISVPHGPGGTAQTYAKGSVYASPAGAFSVRWPVLPVYFGRNGAAGVLGFPSGAMTCNGSACSQTFTGGTIHIRSDGRSVVTSAAIDEVAARDADVLGSRTSGLLSLPYRGGATAQAYVKGSVYHSAAGVFSVVAPFLTPYFAQNGAAGPLGYPTTSRLSLTGGSAQAFNGGSIYSSSAGTHAVMPPFLGAYFALSGATGPLGYPTSGVLGLPGGSAQAFRNGSIYSSGSGTHAVVPPFLAPYFAHRGATGPLGYPTSGRLTLAGGSAQAFRGGSIYSSAAGTYAVAPPLLGPYFASGGATGSWGYPAGPMSCSGGTCTQRFANGVRSALG